MMMRYVWRSLVMSTVLLTGCQSTQPLVTPVNNPNPIVLPPVESSVINPY